MSVNDGEYPSCFGWLLMVKQFEWSMMLNECEYGLIMFDND